MSVEHANESRLNCASFNADSEYAFSYSATLSFFSEQLRPLKRAELATFLAKTLHCGMRKIRCFFTYNRWNIDQ